MTNIPTPKYRIGDVVYFPTIESIVESLPCPDCLGTRQWAATSPAGEEHTIACPRCTDQSHSGRDNLPPLKVHHYAPKIRRVTIGAITVKTHPYSGDDNVEYMTNTTGSGSIYRERQLFPTEASALAKAEVDAALKNAEVNATPAVTRARAFSGLTYTTAAIAALKDDIFNSWEAFRSLRYAIESALPDDHSNDTEDQQSIREAVERYGRYGGTYLQIERHPIDALIEAFDGAEAFPDKSQAAIEKAIVNLKRIAGFPDKPEDQPCTCRHIGASYFREADCPRHRTKDVEI